MVQLGELSALGYINYVYSIALSPDMRHLAAGLAWKGGLDLWELAPGRMVNPLRSQLDVLPVHAVAFSPDGEFLAAAGSTGLALVSALDGVAVTSLPGTYSHFNQLCFTHDGRTLVAADPKEGVRLVSVPSFTETTLPLAVKGVCSVATSAESGLALAGCYDGTVHLLDLEHWTEVISWFQDDTDQPLVSIYEIGPGRDEEHVVEISKFTSVALSPDARYALTATRTSPMRLWDLRIGREVCRFSPANRPIDVTAFLSGSDRVMCCCSDGAVYVWAIPPACLQSPNT